MVRCAWIRAGPRLALCPNLPRYRNDVILERLRSRFGVGADTVEFLPLGYDSNATVYRVHARDGDGFLKIRRGPVEEAGLAVPQLLTADGIPHAADDLGIDLT